MDFDYPLRSIAFIAFSLCPKVGQLQLLLLLQDIKYNITLKRKTIATLILLKIIQ